MVLFKPIVLIYYMRGTRTFIISDVTTPINKILILYIYSIAYNVMQVVFGSYITDDVASELHTSRRFYHYSQYNNLFCQIAKQVRLYVD